MKKSYIILAALSLVLLTVGGYFIVKNQLPTQPQTAKNPQVNRNLPQEVTVTLDKNGFSPKKVTIKRGTAVRWKNVSGGEQSVNSDDHPTHQLHRELNFGVFQNGSTFGYTFKQTGTYKYHNHLQPEQSGTILVEK